MKRFGALLVMVCCPQLLWAHPHVYIDASVNLIFGEDGSLSEVEVAWSYDALYSLLILSDYALDEDGDGQLTDEESQLLQGFDSDWQPDSQGGLYLSASGAAVDLAAPQDFSAEYRDGKLISRHIRKLRTPWNGEGRLQVEFYDPEFYVDFSAADNSTVKGRENCAIKRVKGDPGASADAYRQAISKLLGTSSDDPAADLVVVDIGSVGADRLDVLCAAGNDP